MRSIAELTAASPVFTGLPARQLELIAGCGTNARFAAEDPLFRAGEQADQFFLIRNGAVALELAPPQDEPITIGTLHDGEVVGWLDYRPAGERTIVDHTEVDDALEGQGLGGLLVREAITAIRAGGKEPIVLCPFARAYVARHPELA